jgi:hypothetical protein
VKVALAPVPIASVLAASPWNQRYVQGVAAQVPVEVNVVAWLRTAGSGEMPNSAVGGAAGHAAVVTVCVVADSQPVLDALRSSIWMRYWVPQSRLRSVTEF